MMGKQNHVRIRNLVIPLLSGFTLLSNPGLAQDSLKITQVPGSFVELVSARAGKYRERLEKNAERGLSRMYKLESKALKRLAKTDSNAAEDLLRDLEVKYKTIQEKGNRLIRPTQYVPSLDTLSTSLQFLATHSPLLSTVKGGEKQLQEALRNLSLLQDELNRGDAVKQFIRERQQYLQGELSKLGVTRELKKINKQAYYYGQQFNELRVALADRQKLERKTLELLSRSKAFQDFLRKNSLLASLFRAPGDNPGDPNYLAGMAGLQTRAQVNGLIQQQISGGGPNATAALRNNLNEAQSQLDQRRNKVMRSGGGNSDDIMPNGFKPNNQKTKSFLQRLEYGTNIQTQQATSFFPVTSDIGLSVAYKLNDKSAIGFGASYKLGWGRNWSNISLSSQGAGLRSFLDWQIKGSFWLTGGYERNYRSTFRDFSALRNLSGWQESGLLGISKVISVKSKLFRKTKFQLLLDFLSSRQIPKTQPVIFRFGYNI